jgi:hypothetical protein
LDASSYFHSVTNRQAMPTSATRNVSRMSPGIDPPVWLSTRGWASDSAIRTAMKLSGTNAPATIANTDA